MYIPGSISNNNISQQQILFNNLKDHQLNKIPSTSNFDLFRELNARYLHDMNRAKHIQEQNLKFSSINNPKKENISSPAKKCNKWCTAHVRISWMIYHKEQQRLKDKEQQMKFPDLKLNQYSNTLSSTFQYRSPFNISDVNNGIPLSTTNAFGGLGSLFPLPPTLNHRKSDINPDWSQFHRNNESRKRSSNVLDNEDNHRSRSPHRSLSNLLNKSSSQKSDNSYLSSYPNLNPLILSTIERQRLSTIYSSLFSSNPQIPMNFDSTLFQNPTKLSNLYPNFDEYSLRLSQQLIGRTNINNNSINPTISSKKIKHFKSEDNSLSKEKSISTTT